MVAPYTGAWIEIHQQRHGTILKIVAPYTGAWIEMLLLGLLHLQSMVAPYTGAWIEIPITYLVIFGFSRTLHGCVD